MYESHFGLRRRPFGGVPDPDCYYPATSHERALAQLLAAIENEEGLALLTGAPGTGKTLVGYCLLDRLGEKAVSAFLTNSHLGNRLELLRALLYDLSLPHDSPGEQELRLVLTDFLLKNYEQGNRTILVIDEAQALTTDLLEELRLLTNLEGRKGKAVQVVLLAQPAFRELLERPELGAFNQRLGVRCELEPLGLDEAGDYLVQHLRTQGGVPEEIVTDEAIAILARGTGGMPRLLNRAAHQALTLAFAAEVNQVDAEIALEALATLGLSDPGGEEQSEEEERAQSLRAGSAEGEASQESDPDPQEPRGPRLGPPLAPESGIARRLFTTPRRPA
jgi:type II secretory pathway predicted ATPase ExeA